MIRILELLYRGVKAEALNTAFFGPQGVMMDAISGGLKMLETGLKQLDPQFEIGFKDFTPLGALGYWNNVYSEISSVNKGLGVSGNLASAMKVQFKDAFIALADVGIEQKEIATNVKQFMDDYGRAMILSTKEMVDMSQMADIFGVESLKIVNSYKDLGISIETTTARMKQLTLQSNKFGVVPSRAVKLIKENLSAVDKYNFKGGTKAFEQMALQAARLNSDMKGSFAMMDKILDGGVEGAVELAQKMQLMGGPIAQMGDVFGLIEKALSGDIEGFEKDMAKAAAQMATISKDGEVMFDTAAMLQFRELATATGASIEEITKKGRAMAKEMDISKQMDLSLKTIPENFDAMLSKVAGAVKGRDVFGNWVVTIDGIEKKVQDLTEDEINAKLSISPEGTSPEDTFKEIIRSNMDLGDILKTLVAEIKKTALGGAGTAYQELLPVIKQIADTGADTIKEYTQSFSDMSEKAYENFGKVLKPFSEGDFMGALGAAKDNIFDTVSTFWNMIKGAVIEIAQIIGNVLWNVGQYILGGINYGFASLKLEFKKAIAEVFGRNTSGPEWQMDPFDKWMEKNKYQIVNVFKDFDWNSITDPIMKGTEKKFEALPGLSEFKSDYLRYKISDEGKPATEVEGKKYIEVNGKIMLQMQDQTKELTKEEIIKLFETLFKGEYGMLPMF